MCFAVKVKGFSNPYLPSQLSRGGDTAEDQQIDEYIDNLIASVDSSSESSSEDVRDDEEVKEFTGNELERVGLEGHAVKLDMVRADLSVEEDNDEAGTYDTQRSAKQANEADNNDVEVAVIAVKGEEENEAASGAREQPSEAKTPDKRKKRRKKIPDHVQEQVQAREEEKDVAVEEEATSPLQPLGPARPNAIYRFLLNQGRIGHILVLICVLIAEFITTYIPPLAHLLGFIFSFLLPSEEAEDGRIYRRGAPRGSAQKVNAQYAAFVSSDGTSVRGKQRKQAVRKADEQAAEKLRRVGSIQDAKFRHVSVDFMKRYVMHWPRQMCTERFISCALL